MCVPKAIKSSSKELVKAKCPINAAILESKQSLNDKKSTDASEGVLIVFHGAPNTSRQAFFSFQFLSIKC